MSRAWQIARKDMRHLLGAWGVWMAFVVGSMLWFGSAPGLVGSALWTWFDIMTLWTRLIVGVQAFFAFVLVGVMVLEDPVVGNDAFWPTRPITRMQLLAGKLLAGGMLFVLGPVAVLVPVWLGLGSTVGTAFAAAANSALWQIPGVLLGVALGGMARSLAQHLLILIFFIAAQLGAGALGATLSAIAGRADGATGAGFVAPAWATAAVLALVCWHQYRWADRGRSAVLLSLTLLVSFGLVRFDRSPAGVPEVERVAGAPRAELALRAERLVGRVDEPLPPWPGTRPALDLRVVQPGRNGLVQVPAGGVGRIEGWADGPVDVRLHSPGVIPESWIQAVAAARPMPEAAVGSLGLQRTSRAGARLAAGTVRVSGVVALQAWRGRLLGSFPARRDGEMTAGANRVRVLDLMMAPDGGRPVALLIEDRDLVAGECMRIESVRAYGSRTAVRDYFVLRTPTASAVLASEEINAVMMRAVTVGARRLVLPAITTEELARSTVVKVRFEAEETFSQAFEGRDVPVQGEPTS